MSRDQSTTISIGPFGVLVVVVGGVTLVSAYGLFGLDVGGVAVVVVVFGLRVAAVVGVVDRGTELVVVVVTDALAIVVEVELDEVEVLESGCGVETLFVGTVFSVSPSASWSPSASSVIRACSLASLIPVRVKIVMPAPSPPMRITETMSAVKVGLTRPLVHQVLGCSAVAVSCGSSISGTKPGYF